jgi:hypothetical protein
MLVALAVLFLVMDCLIIGGKNPRKWKGGGKE